MGEYAKHQGDRIKIGTCEDMYYLRADQVHLVQHIEGNVDPSTDDSIRFRFPWPDEDRVGPGQFDDPFRGYAVQVEPPRDVDHGPIQFRNDRGLLVSLPCPCGPNTAPYTIHRNGFAGPTRIVQQRRMHGLLMLVCECTSCGAKWRCETLEDAEQYAVKCPAPIAERIRAGYKKEKYIERNLISTI